MNAKVGLRFDLGGFPVITPNGECVVGDMDNRDDGFSIFAAGSVIGKPGRGDDRDAIPGGLRSAVPMAVEESQDVFSLDNLGQLLGAIRVKS